MNQIEVQILQQNYLLTCPAGQEQHLRQAVERVNNTMTQIRDAGRVRARERIAVLAALNVAYELINTDGETPAGASSITDTPHQPPPEPTTAIAMMDAQLMHSLSLRIEQALQSSPALQEEQAQEEAVIAPVAQDALASPGDHPSTDAA